MQEKYRVYIDEFGAYGFSSKSFDATSHFILVAILVKEEECGELERKVEEVRSHYFQTGEMKSSKLKGNIKGHRRRKLILEKLKDLPFQAFVLSVDKRELWNTSGMVKSKGVFYKFFNQLLYNELRKNFSNLEFWYDAVGTSEYAQDFLKYVRRQSMSISLFDEYRYQVVDSQNSVIVQLADLIAGSIAYSLDEIKRRSALGNDYLRLLRERILTVEHFPLKYDMYTPPRTSDYQNYNVEIANIAYRRAVEYINRHEESDIGASVLRYLLFRFMHNSHRRYISTKELIGYLSRLEYTNLSTQSFRMRAIAPLRDAGVIIASSKEGYKLPTTMEEVRDFLNHSQKIIFPMLNRLNECIKAFRISSYGEIDFGEEEEFSDLNSLLEVYVSSQN